MFFFFFHLKRHITHPGRLGRTTKRCLGTVCGNEISNGASTDHTVDGYPQCTWLCAATIAREDGTQEVCGGYAFLSVYNNTDPGFSPPGSGSSPGYVGCFAEGADGRTLRGASTSSAGGMTVEACEAFAREGNSGAGYRYAGVEYGSQCYVGNSIIPPAAAALNDTSSPPSSQCDMACSGDGSEVCGGPGVLSVYLNPAYAADSAVKSPIGDYEAEGCLTDSQSSVGLRALDGTEYLADDGMTEDMCVGYCQDRGYRYAGYVLVTLYCAHPPLPVSDRKLTGLDLLMNSVEYATQCYCGNEIINDAQLVDCGNYELSACPGDIHQVCGAANLMNLYDSGGQ